MIIPNKDINLFVLFNKNNLLHFLEGYPENMSFVAEWIFWYVRIACILKLLDDKSPILSDRKVCFCGPSLAIAGHD